VARQYESVSSKKPKPQRNPNMPTDAERLAAVQGKLEPRTVKGTKAQHDLQKTGANEMPVGHPVGIETGLPVFMAICYALQQNERAKRQQAKGNKEAKVLTDDEISAWLKAEFPGREAKYWNEVQNLRSNFNNGYYTRGIKPHYKSHRYDSGGKTIDPVYRRKRKK
jgi:hypothetical protein